MASSVLDELVFRAKNISRGKKEKKLFHNDKKDIKSKIYKNPKHLFT